MKIAKQLFSESNRLFQGCSKRCRAPPKIISEFMNFERPELINFTKAIELFTQDIPKVTETLCANILAHEKANRSFILSNETFLKFCYDCINPYITNDNIREMKLHNAAFIKKQQNNSSIT